MTNNHTVLVLPFTHSILSDPHPILHTIHQQVINSIESCTVLFSTPRPGGGEVGSGDEQLYITLSRSPKKYWDVFQRFLGKVYATMAAAQWRVGRVLMDVEVGFDGGMDLEKRFKGEEGLNVVLLDSHRKLPILVSLKEVLGDYTSTFITSPLGVFSNTPISIDQTKSDLPTDTGGYPTTALGGTFDHLHAAHKLLLHLSLFLTTKKLIVGIMTRHLLSTKSNAQLLESLDTRIRRVTDFLQRCGSDIQGVKLDVVEIMDPYGPTAWDKDIQALVVSRETYSGGEAVNKKRKSEGLGELDVWVIDVIAAEPEPEPEPEAELVGEGNSHVESKGDVAGTRDEEDTAGGGAEEHHNPVKTRDLSSETDEGKLKALKMGSTAIRQWIKDHPEQA